MIMCIGIMVSMSLVRRIYTRAWGVIFVVTYILSESGHKRRPDEHVADDQDDNEHYEEGHLSVHSTFEAELGRFPERVDQLAEGSLDEIPLHPVKLAKSLRINQLGARIP